MYLQHRRKLILVVVILIAVFSGWYLVFLNRPGNQNINLPSKSLSGSHDEIAPSSSKNDTLDVSHCKFFHEKYPVTYSKSFPSRHSSKLPRIQYDFPSESKEDEITRLERLITVKKVFERPWQAYKKHSWMRDELSPLDAESKTTFGGWGATLVDTLDTLWMMGMEGEFELAVQAVKDIDFSSSDTETLNVFETTIRFLGGFLGAYDTSNGKYPILLQKATEVGELLYCAFDTPNRMPVSRWQWKQALKGKSQSAGENTLIAELGSLSLEFTRLSQLTNDFKYFDAVRRIMTELEKVQSKTKLPGLWPVVVNATSLNFDASSFTLGGMADSVYEYLPKQYMLLGGNSQMAELYNKSIVAAESHILFRPMIPDNQSILVSGDANVQESFGMAMKIVNEPKGQHLSCFAGGMVGLGAKLFDRPSHLKLARNLVDGCIWAYENMPTQGFVMSQSRTLRRTTGWKAFG